MGPHSSEQGKQSSGQGRPEGPNGECFNGASLFRARKPGIRGHNAFRNPTVYSFNGASLFRARKRPRVDRCILAAAGGCFNGASLFRARKHSPDSDPRPSNTKRHASMGPHSSEQGNLVPDVAASSRPTHRASMGPHSSEQGNATITNSPSGLQVCSMKLQWGLTLPSKETRLTIVARGRLELSSFNGASLFRARKRLFIGKYVSCFLGFNGASLFRARKRYGLWISACADSAGCSLQWGLTLPSKETIRANGTMPSVVSLNGFNGASLFRARKHSG